jgi:hypothetical protein
MAHNPFRHQEITNSIYKFFADNQVKCITGYIMIGTAKEGNFAIIC